jgi:hypothetical protein
MKTVPDILRDCADTYEQRNKLYGDNYKKFGRVMMAVFPNGLVLSREDDFNRLGIFIQCVSKLTRYSEMLGRGGHQDSAHDLSVYAAMLEELTHDHTA